MNPGPLDMIAAKLRQGGEFRVGTDHPVYCRWTMMQMGRRTDFRWLAETAADFQDRPADWPQTRYEAKARRLGHEIGRAHVCTQVTTEQHVCRRRSQKKK